MARCKFRNKEFRSILAEGGGRRAGGGERRAGGGERRAGGGVRRAGGGGRRAMSTSTYNEYTIKLVLKISAHCIIHIF